MLKQLKEKGYNQGYNEAKKMKNSGAKRKEILKLSIDEKTVTKEIMAEYRDIGYAKAFSLSCAYVSSWDFGLRQGAFEE
jgi:hypothetical protein